MFAGFYYENCVFLSVLMAVASMSPSYMSNKRCA